MAVVFEFAPTGTITNGAAVVQTGWTVDSGVVYDTGNTFQDLSASAKLVSTSSSTKTVTQTLGSSVTTRYFSRVYKVGAFTAGTFTGLTRLRNSAGTALAEVRINSTGELILRDITTGTNLATSQPVSFGVKFRFEWDIVGTQTTLRVYPTPTSTTPSETLGPFTQSWGSFNTIVDGVSATATATTVNILYAADASTTPNPGIARWASQLAEGLRTYVTYGGTRTRITSIKRA